MTGQPEFDRLRASAGEALRRGDVESACVDLCRALFVRRDAIAALQAICRLLAENPALFAASGLPKAAPPTGPVSVVTCSIDPAKFERARASWAKAFGDAPWELVGIHDAKSLAEGLRRGLDRSAGKVIVFAHDDIELLSGNLPAALSRAFAAADLVGVVGTTRLTGPAHAWSGTAFTRGRIVHPPKPDGTLVLDLFNLAPGLATGLQAIDGVFMAARRELIEEVGFDAATFDGFHLYDIDFSYRAHRAGWRVGVSSEIVLRHDSEGGFDARWAEYAGRFLAKFPEVRGERAENRIMGVPFRDVASLLAFSARLDVLGRRALAA